MSDFEREVDRTLDAPCGCFRRAHPDEPFDAVVILRDCYECLPKRLVVAFRQVAIDSGNVHPYGSAAMFKAAEAAALQALRGED